MELMLEVISRHKFSLGEAATYIFGNVGGYIGRDKECEWVLPDKSQRLSRKHALISCDGSAFYIEDLSTNGIYTLLGHERLPHGQRYKLEHGASFVFGDYTIQARLIQRPDAYISQSLEDSTELIPDKAFLNLDPLEAMDQQEEHEAKVRLGMYNDILGTSEVAHAFQQDHTDSRRAAMPSIGTIPEDWSLEDDSEAFVPKPERTGGAYAGPFKAGVKSQPFVSGGAVPLENNTANYAVNNAAETAWAENFTSAVEAKASSEPAGQAPSGGAPQADLEFFFKLLGFASVPTDKQKREQILRNSAELIIAAVNGMIGALQNRAESKNELRLPITTMGLVSNNPLKFSPTAQAALEHLLEQKQKGMLPAGQAMLSGFDDLHGHHMGLLSGARAAVRAALETISPEKVAARLEVNGPVRINRTARLWHTYKRMHQSLLEDNDGFAAFFLKDFARAYELQNRTLSPMPPKDKEI